MKVHDTSAVEKHIYEELCHARRRRRLESYNKRVIYIVLILFASGILSILLALAYRIAFAPAKTIIHKDSSQLEGIKSEIEKKIKDLEEADKNTEGALKNDNDTVVFDYTIFAKVPVTIGSIKNVLTGMNYDSSNADYPNYQYCYISIPHENSKYTETKIDIAQKYVKMEIEFYDPNEISKELQGITAAQILKAQEHCKFIGKGNSH